ncbi:hypothetical protein EMIHUDRAFT_453322, partial [Emiliania huxleyi CCMP1516]|uniref:P-type ATPase A domain-containing protein n=2 Tax=Emiliania huxleyi TaxID=2903 RepID=A0A0D3I891_EMIH1
MSESWQERAFRRASWGLMALLCASYLLQLTEPAERASAQATQHRLATFVADAEAHAAVPGLSRPERAQRLAGRFGGLLADWSSRFRGDDGDGGGDEDGALRAPLHRPPPRTLLGRLLRCCACLGAPGPKRTASSAPSRSVRGGGRLSLRAACAAVCSGLRSAALFPCLELEPNRVCNTRALAVKLPLRPPLVCALKFVASLLLYFSQPDDFFFLFVAFGQILETGSFRSCGPVAFFCFLFCTFEALAAYSQASHDTEINQRRCTVCLQGGETAELAWSAVERGCVVRLSAGESPPCDLLIRRVHGGGLRAREKDLTGESKPVNKMVPHQMAPPASAQHASVATRVLLVTLLLAFTYDNTLAIFATAAAWYASLGMQVNVWQAAVARLGEIATETASAAVLTDKTGTLTVNRMSTQAAARRLSTSDGCDSWAVFSARPPTAPLPESARRGSGRAGVERDGGGGIGLLPPVPFPPKGEPLHDAEGDAAAGAALDMALAWSATTGELPGVEIGEAEEASFLERHPGTLLRNVTDGQGGARIVFTLPTRGGQALRSGAPGGGDVRIDVSALEATPLLPPPPPVSGVGEYLQRGGGDEVHAMHVRLLLPLDLKLRAKGALARTGSLDSGAPSPGRGESGGFLGLWGGSSSRASSRADADGGCTLVAQGAGSFFRAVHPPNSGIIDLLEGGSASASGVLYRCFDWRGSVRIWWHGERRLSAAEGDALVSEYVSAPSEEARAAVLSRAYRGLASAMEDPYQEAVPEAIAALRAEGYRLMMVTGDSDAAAENIAYATGLAVRPGTRPTAPAAPPAGSEADVERGEAAAAG